VRCLAERFRGFSGRRPAASTWRCDTRGSRGVRTLDTRGWEYDLDLEPGPAGVRVAGLRFFARIAREPLAATLVTCANPAELAGVVENVLRILVAHALVARGGVLLHAAGVAEGDRARVFFGVSGAGKTTLSRLAQEEGRRILSDDMVALVPETGRSNLAIPFAGIPRRERTTAPASRGS
jgi:hypothetical protein